MVAGDAGSAAALSLRESYSQPTQQKAKPVRHASEYAPTAWPQMRLAGCRDDPTARRKGIRHNGGGLTPFLGQRLFF